MRCESYHLKRIADVMVHQLNNFQALQHTSSPAALVAENQCANDQSRDHVIDVQQILFKSKIPGSVIASYSDKQKQQHPEYDLHRHVARRSVSVYIKLHV